MAGSKFENIPIKPNIEQKSPNDSEQQEKQQKEKDIQLENRVKLINLQIGDEFLIPGSDIRYRVSVKYAKNRITAREKGTVNVVELDGELEIIPLVIKNKKHSDF